MHRHLLCQNAKVSSEPTPGKSPVESSWLSATCSMLGYKVWILCVCVSQVNSSLGFGHSETHSNLGLISVSGGGGGGGVVVTCYLTTQHPSCCHTTTPPPTPTPLSSLIHSPATTLSLCTINFLHLSFHSFLPSPTVSERVASPVITARTGGSAGPRG